MTARRSAEEIVVSSPRTRRAGDTRRYVAALDAVARQDVDLGERRSVEDVAASSFCMVAITAFALSTPALRSAGASSRRLASIALARSS